MAAALNSRANDQSNPSETSTRRGNYMTGIGGRPSIRDDQEQNPRQSNAEIVKSPSLKQRAVTRSQKLLPQTPEKIQRQDVEHNTPQSLDSRVAHENHSPVDAISSQRESAVKEPKHPSTPQSTTVIVKKTVYNTWIGSIVVVAIGDCSIKNIAFLLAIFFGLGGCAVWHQSNRSSNELLQIIPANETQVGEFFTNFAMNFPGQKNDSWKVLRAEVKAIVRKEPAPKQPAVIMLLSKKGAESTTRCLAKRLSFELESLLSANNSYFIHEEGKRYKTMEGTKLKVLLETAAIYGFGNGSHVFLMENVNVIPAEGAMMFHGLCDNDSAPFKRVVYLMTVDVADLDVDSGLSDDELKAIDVATVWSEYLDIDRRAALESRIGGSKIVVERESKMPNLPDCN